MNARQELIKNLRIKASMMQMGERIAWGSDTALMLQAAAALEADKRVKVGDSRFEGWYSELQQAGKGSKQIAREAYEAGLNEADKRGPLSDDKARLDWLEQNLLNRENLTLQGKVDKDYNMWVMFSPRGTQGSARAIIDAAIAHDRGDKP